MYQQETRLSSQQHDNKCTGEEKDLRPKIIMHNVIKGGTDTLDQLVRECTGIRSTRFESV
jgi:hypothetical protein